MSILQNSNAISAGGYDINNSLRFRSSASAYLSRTPASAGNRKTWTWSAWIKLGTISVNMGTLFIAQGQTAIYLNDGTNSSFRVNGAAGSDLITSLMPRDPSAWYHLVVACDTTQATDTNRLKIYVNGVQQTAFQAGSAYPTLNGDTYVNSTAAHYIGRRVWNGDQQYDGYIAEQYLIDGSQKAASDFGETDTTTGVWKPKAYTGTYGTNGFYLKFSDIATTSGSNAGLGKDFSGNTNYWTTNNISVTSGTTYDAMTDSPTLTSATVANYAVMNPLWKDGTTVIAQGNLDVSNGNYGGFSTLTIPTNSKFYAEFTVTATQGNQGVGILKAANAYSGVISQADMFGSNSVTYYSTNGNKFVLGGGSTAYGSSWGTIGDVIGIAVNTVDNQITFYKNNVSQGLITGLTSGIEWVFATGNQTNTGGGAWNFGQRPFTYTPPTGFVALNTYNLPTPTILQGNKYMDATLWTGNGTSQTITNAGAFKPDLVWAKMRSSAGYFHDVVDSVRGANTRLCPNSTQAEDTASNAYLTAFNSNGFNIGSNSDWNRNADTYVGWQWQAGQGSTSSNTSGSITSTVSVNTTAGFSVVTYSGSNSNSTVGHGLGVAPSMITIKRRNSGSDGWQTYHASLGNNKLVYLNSTQAVVTGVGTWQNTTPTSTLIYLEGNNSGVCQSGGTYVAYCWAEIAGFSKFGSYTGNGSTDGPFIYTGFRPKYVMTKLTSAAGQDWAIKDTSRNTYNASSNTLLANLADAEYSANGDIDIISNGFKIRTTNGNQNNSGATYIYIAFAENPFKNANAR